MSRDGRCIAPQLLAVEGSAALPGIARWQSAFTTSLADWPVGQCGPSHLHRSQFWTVIRRPGMTGTIQWRLESQPAPGALAAPIRVVEGESISLDLALGAAFEAAQRGTSAPASGILVAPAFIPLQVVPGAPRIWGCAGLYAHTSGTGEAGVPFSQTCFIREFLTPQEPSYVCTLEDGDATETHLAHWHAPNLAAAVAQCEQAMLRRGVGLGFQNSR
jgi:hypothetical protein